MSHSLKQTSTPLLTLLALGIVFGDIGTSPIYAFQQSVSDGQSNLNGIYGTVSLIFWALMIVVSIKYLIFVLRADNKGEGGVLALFSLLPSNIRNPETRRKFIVFGALMLGTAFLFGDGMITPAISVLSAVEGTGEINPNWVHFEVPITVVILIALFIYQSRGTDKIGKLFGPIMLVWFITIGGLGLREIAMYTPILKALSPSYAISYIGDERIHTLIILSSVILAITGVEALYADMGHFGALPIRVGWFVVVAPCLVANYLGQAALEIKNPKAASALFFNLAPNKGMLVFLVFISTLATVIASQALISGVGSISRQAIQLGFFPRLQVIHTSDTHEGQIYVPVMNTILGISTVFLVCVFGSSARLANAYSFAIAGTMLITTLAFYIVAVNRWRWNRVLTGVLVGFLGIIDLGFFTSTSTKIFKGAWLPLLVGVIAMFAMFAWRKGQNLLTQKISTEVMKWDYVDSLVDSGRLLTIPTIGIYLTAAPNHVPQALQAQILNLHAIPNRIVLVHVKTTDNPYGITKHELTHVSARALQAIYEVGYMESISIPKLIQTDILSASEELAATYYLVDRKIIGSSSGELQGLTHKVFSFLHRNASNASRYFGLPESRVVTLSVQVDL